MGRTQVTRKFEITAEIKELQRLAIAPTNAGYGVDIDITQDLVTINGHQHLTRAQAKAELIEITERLKNAKTTSDFPDQEEVARKAKEEAKLAKKHREPGTPPELKTLIRRSKRIYKKAINKGTSSADADAKAQTYIQAKATADNITQVQEALADYIVKESSKTDNIIVKQPESTL